MNSLKRLLFAALLVLMMALAACQPQAPAPATPTVGAPPVVATPVPGAPTGGAPVRLATATKPANYPGPETPTPPRAYPAGTPGSR